MWKEICLFVSLTRFKKKNNLYIQLLLTNFCFLSKRKILNFSIVDRFYKDIWYSFVLVNAKLWEYTQGRIIGRCLSTAKYGQFYGRPNHPSYSKNNVWPKNLFKTCQNKGLLSASHLTWSMLTKLSTLPLLKYPLMVPGASSWSFTTLLTQGCLFLQLFAIQMSKNALKSIEIDGISDNFCGLMHQYLAKLTA